MRTLVNQARGDIHRSGVRWPFELTQNAHDPGPRPGSEQVQIHLSFDGKTVIYEHNGKPFSMGELAALLSGGSSKEFESKETTGRFGTGFLLTHALSFQIQFEGILATESGLEMVHLCLDRAGDEERIYANTILCSAAIEKAVALHDLDNQPTARFTYSTDNPDAARIGLAAFSRALPYLYGTCEHLGPVTIESDNHSLQVNPDGSIQIPIQDATALVRRLAVTEADGTERIMKVVRILREPSAATSLVVVLEELGDTCRLLELAPNFPRFFCRFPIRGSEFLPVNSVIDGRFELAQERDVILMKDTDKAQISCALNLMPSLVQFALQQKWQLGYKLARVGMPQIAFGDTLEEPLRGWWKEQLSSVAKRLADMPIVETVRGEFHHVSDPAPNADFVFARFDLAQTADELQFASVWKASTELQSALPPTLEIAQDWTAMAMEWMGLGIDIRRLALANLADKAREDAKTVDELNTFTPQLEWLARFLNLVGEIAPQHNCAAILNNLLPDQNRSLRSPAALCRDAGVHEVLKNISSQIKLDVRGRLLLQELDLFSGQSDLPHLRTLLEAQIPRTLDDSAVIEECIGELSKQLPDTKTIPLDKQVFREGSIDLLKFLWDSQGPKAAALAQKCPMISSDGSAVRWTPQRKIMAPVSTWSKDAQPFYQVYKSDRILSEEYVSRMSGDKALVQALVAWDMAFADPLYIDSPKELANERLKAIAELGCDCEGVTVAGSEFSQIALLPNELIQRCQNDETLAKLLFGLVLNHAARNDKCWQEHKNVEGRRNKQTINITVTPALWVADLRSKAWVPVPGEQGTENVIANAGNLKKYLDPDWLSENNLGLKLLTQYFGFNVLELRILATAPTPESRKELETSLANLVQVIGANTAEYDQLTINLLTKKLREIEKERNRKFGLAVQAAIEKYLTSCNLHLELIDCGYDYDVFVDEVAPIEAGTHHFKLADYLLEVKATTTGEVRMTPAQASTASEFPERFILCVVDLREISQAQMGNDWTADDVEPKTKIVIGIGPLVNQSHGLVAQAKQCKVGIRNDAALRYGVPVQVWNAGIAVSEWVQQVKNAQSANAPGGAQNEAKA